MGYLLQQLSEAESEFEAGHGQELDVVVDGPVGGQTCGIKLHDAALVHRGGYFDSEDEAGGPDFDSLKFH